MKKTTLLLLLFIWVARIDAQPIESQPLHTVLNSDGTLKQGIRGSFRVNGYQMQLDAKGRPLFRLQDPMSNMTTSITWDRQFGYPNGIGEGQFTVFAIATDGAGNCYVGGDFRLAGGVGVPVNNIACFNTSTNTWSTLGSSGGSGVNNVVQALAVVGNDLYVGGQFTEANIGGTVVSANRVARFNTLTNTWSALTGAGGGNGVSGLSGSASVLALAVLGNEVFVGGVFTEANTGGTPVPANNLARFNTSTNTWSAVTGAGGGNGVNNDVYALAVLGNEVFVGGVFTEVNTGGTVVSANRVARFNTLTNTWSALTGAGGGNGVGSSSGTPNVLALAVLGSEVFVGGIFTQANTGGTVVSASRVARFNTTTNTWSALGTGVGGTTSTRVNAFTVVGGDLYVGGSFTSAGGTPVKSIARFNTSTNTWSALGSGGGNGISVSGIVYALAPIGNDVFVGGFFGSANVGGSLEVEANSIARFNITTSAWSPLSGAVGFSYGTNLYVNALAVIGSDLYVGGEFSAVGGVSTRINNIARFNTITNTWSALGSGGGNGVNGNVNALAVIGSDLYVGGVFTQANVGGTIVNTNYVARFNTATSTWSALGSGSGNGVNSTVFALAAAGSDLYVGGNFSRADAGGTNIVANRVARFNTTTNTWSALISADGGNGVSSSGTPSVDAIVVVSSDVFVGGEFSFANIGAATITANNIARFNTSTNTWSALGSGGGNGVNDEVLALAVLGGDLYVGGRFDQVNTGGTNDVANSIARFNPATNTWSALGSSGGNGVGGDVYSLFAAGSDLYVGGIFSQVNVFGPSVAANCIARFNTTTNAWSALGNPSGNGVNDDVLAIALLNGDVFIGGRFEQANMGGSASIVSAFIGRYFDGTSPVPVELSSFSAQRVERGVELVWTTASEKNNAGFEVQRRSENQGMRSGAWQVLGFVRGAGTTSDAKSYSFVDRTASGKVQYRLKQVDFDGTFEMLPTVEVDAGLPRTFELGQNYPNPFNPTTLISYQLPVASEVSLKVYDVLGREVATLVNGRQEAGRYSVSFNASGFASGVYFYRLQSGAFVETKKMMLVK